MGKSDEQIEEEMRKKQRSAARKALPPSNGKGNGTADWESANAGLVHRLVCSVAADGGAVRFGYTRDGGAYSIGIYLGGDSKTYYCNEKEGIDVQLEDLVDYFRK